MTALGDGGSQMNDNFKHLELRAIFFVIHSFLLLLPGHHVVIFLDNAMAVSYINQQGGTVSRFLCKLAVKIWDLCIANHIHPVSMHVSGIENVPQQKDHHHSHIRIEQQAPFTSFSCMGIPRCRCLFNHTQYEMQTILHKRGQRSSL